MLKNFKIDTALDINVPDMPTREDLANMSDAELRAFAMSGPRTYTDRHMEMLDGLIEDAVEPGDPRLREVYLDICTTAPLNGRFYGVY
jgi:hypothetical protein